MALKGEKIMKILEILLETGGELSDVIMGHLASGHLVHPLIIKKNIKRQARWRKALCINLREKQRICNLLSYLKRQGIVQRDNRRWLITNRGHQWYTRFKQIITRKKEYTARPAPELKIIMFDIPEKYRAQREWIRNVLKMLEFRMLQKSVWAGRMYIPQEFIKEAHQRKMLHYIDIIAVTKSGTLKNYNIADDRQ